MDKKLVKQLIDRRESNLLEFKREWWDLESKLGKAHFARDVLAMANSLSPGESAFIIIGVQDRKVGGGVVGIDESPSEEAVAQILATYTNPVPRIRLEQHEVDAKKVSIVEVIWDEAHPYYAARDIDTILSTDVVYIRRAGTVGRLKPAELERLIRAKENRVGKFEPEELQVGFVELPPSGHPDRVSFRVANVTEEPVTGISAVIDIIRVHYSDVHRMSVLTELALKGGETREAEIQLSNAQFWDEKQQRYVRSEGFVWSRWFDLRLIVRYRAYDGLLRQITRHASLGA